jgi:hypothetical protein
MQVASVTSASAADVYWAAYFEPPSCGLKTNVTLTQTDNVAAERIAICQQRVAGHFTLADPVAPWLDFERRACARSAFFVTNSSAGRYKAISQLAEL